ncbi:MAG: hypothetical protein NT051_07085, partial [Candidatus Micrarchaeota archaeon]|nr:hypothetical protein [Candidatus Micrarchaeota archaeon]
STKLAEINVIPSYSGKDVTGYSADLPAGFASSKGEIPVKSDGRELFSLNEKDRADLFAGTLLEKDDFKVKFNGNKLEITIVPKVKDNDIVVVDMAPVAPYIYATGDCKVPEIDAMLSSPAVLEKIKNKVLGYGVTAQTFNEKLPNFIRFVNDDKLKGENSLLSLSPVKDWEELAGMLKDYIGN